jgi:hypothetical protein
MAAALESVGAESWHQGPRDPALLTGRDPAVLPMFGAPAWLENT